MKYCWLKCNFCYNVIKQMGCCPANLEVYFTPGICEALAMLEFFLLGFAVGWTEISYTQCFKVDGVTQVRTKTYHHSCLIYRVSHIGTIPDIEGI